MVRGKKKNASVLPTLPVHYIKQVEEQNPGKSKKSLKKLIEQK